jgi:hypothetical protein
MQSLLAQVSWAQLYPWLLLLAFIGSKSVDMTAALRFLAPQQPYQLQVAVVTLSSSRLAWIKLRVWEKVVMLRRAVIFYDEPGWISVVAWRLPGTWQAVALLRLTSQRQAHRKAILQDSSSWLWGWIQASSFGTWPSRPKALPAPS